MKKVYLVVVWMLCCLMLAGCGDREGERGSQEANVSSGSGENNPSPKSGDTAEYYDIVTNTIQIFDILSADWKSLFAVEGAESWNPMCLGMQYYKGEAVQLWGVETRDGDAGICAGQTL